MAELLNNILFIFERFSWLSVIDILLVTLMFYGLLYWLRGTQAMVSTAGRDPDRGGADPDHQPGEPAGIFMADTKFIASLIAGRTCDLCTGNTPRAGTNWAGREPW